MGSSLVPAEGVELDPTDMVMVDELTPMQNMYQYWRGYGFTPRQSAKKSGYKDLKQAIRVNEANPIIRKSIEEMASRVKVRHKVDRDAVVDGLMEALSVARERSDAKQMISGWVEIARITGVQAPEVKVMKVEGEITQTHISQAPDAELLKILGKERTLPIIDAEFEDITDVEIEPNE